MALTIRPAVLIMVPAAALALVPTLMVAPAHADPPPNDDISGAITVTPDSTTTFDSTEATSDVVHTCVGDKSVWFRFTAESTGRVALTTAGSSFDTRLAIYTGRRGNPQRVSCDNNGGPGESSSLDVFVGEGQRYWIAVSSATTPGAGGPGVLRWGSTTTPVDVVVEGARSGGGSGRMIVFGTVTCEDPAEVWLSAVVSQRVGGDRVARGWGRNRRQCNEEPVGWQIPIDSETGWAFQPGLASLTLTTGVWNGLDFARATRRTTVTAVDDPDSRTAP